MIAQKLMLPFIVSTDWLSENSTAAVVLDVRDDGEYRAGHIPGSVSAPFATWTTNRDGLTLEVPDRTDLFAVVGRAGIKPESAVVVAGRTDGNYPRADTARVACTLIYAGVPNVGIMDGGSGKWAAEDRPLTAESSHVESLSFLSKTSDGMFVTKAQVHSMIGQAVIIDCREPEVYVGLLMEPTAARAGHIPTARCLPAPWLWTVQGTYRPVDEIARLAHGIVGSDIETEIILYCGVGGYAAAWWFALTRGLGYRNVRFYDGSAQEWSRDPEAPMVSFKWE
jgi:thiosulfate/3-mercaptopyruvate sulfurtransferase